MPEWTWLRAICSWIPFHSQKDWRDNFDVVAGKSIELIETLQEDLQGLRETVRQQDVHNRNLREEIQRLHQQHMHCETIQQELRVRLEKAEQRVAELDDEVRELQRSNVGN